MQGLCGSLPSKDSPWLNLMPSTEGFVPLFLRSIAPSFATSPKPMETAATIGGECMWSWNHVLIGEADIYLEVCASVFIAEDCKNSYCIPKSNDSTWVFSVQHSSVTNQKSLVNKCLPGLPIVPPPLMCFCRRRPISRIWLGPPQLRCKSILLTWLMAMVSKTIPWAGVLSCWLAWLMAMIGGTSPQTVAMIPSIFFRSPCLSHMLLSIAISRNPAPYLLARCFLNGDWTLFLYLQQMGSVLQNCSEEPVGVILGSHS